MAATTGNRAWTLFSCQRWFPAADSSASRGSSAQTPRRTKARFREFVGLLGIKLGQPEDPVGTSGVSFGGASGIELAQSFVIGDSWRDARAARAAGCVAITLDRSYNHNADADYRVPSLGHAAQLILETLLR